MGKPITHYNPTRRAHSYARCGELRRHVFSGRHSEFHASPPNHRGSAECFSWNTARTWPPPENCIWREYSDSLKIRTECVLSRKAGVEKRRHSRRKVPCADSSQILNVLVPCIMFSAYLVDACSGDGRSHYNEHYCPRGPANAMIFAQLLMNEDFSQKQGASQGEMLDEVATKSRKIRTSSAEGSTALLLWGNCSPSNTWRANLHVITVAGRGAVRT